MSIRGAVALVLLSVAVGCAGEAAQPGDVQYEIDGGFPPGPRSLHIEPDGHATRTTPENGTQTRVIDPAALDQLNQKIAAAGFPELDPEYLCTGVCPLSATPLHTVTVQLGDHAYKVVADPLKVSVPPRLFAVIDALEITLDEGEWR